MLDFLKPLLDMREGEKYGDSVNRRADSIAFSKEGEDYGDGVKRRLNTVTDTRKGETYPDGVNRRGKSIYNALGGSTSNTSNQPTATYRGHGGGNSTFINNIHSNTANDQQLQQKYIAIQKAKEEQSKAAAVKQDASKKQQQQQPLILPQQTTPSYLAMLKEAMGQRDKYNSEYLKQIADENAAYERRDLVNNQPKIPEDKSWLGQNKSWLMPLMGIGGMVAANALGGGNAAAGFGQGWQGGMKSGQDRNDAQNKAKLAQMNKQRALQLGQLDGEHKDLISRLNAGLKLNTPVDDTYKMLSLQQKVDAAAAKASGGAGGNYKPDQVSSLVKSMVVADGIEPEEAAVLKEKLETYFTANPEAMRLVAERVNSVDTATVPLVGTGVAGKEMLSGRAEDIINAFLKQQRQ